MAIHFTSEQRLSIAEKIMEFGNLGAAATVIGQFVTPQQFNVLILLFGISFFLCFYIIGIFIMRGGEIS